MTALPDGNAPEELQLLVPQDSTKTNGMLLLAKLVPQDNILLQVHLLVLIVLLIVQVVALLPVAVLVIVVGVVQLAKHPPVIQVVLAVVLTLVLHVLGIGIKAENNATIVLMALLPVEQLVGDHQQNKPTVHLAVHI